MAAKTPAISLRDLGRDYGERAALDGIEVELPAGQTLAVLGPNGSGKTTLLRVLAGLLRPSRGRATVLGCDLPGEVWRLRGRVGYLAHEPLLYRDLSARENLRLAARLHGIERASAESRIESLLAAVAMGERGDDRVAELSAGMAQRVAASRAVLHQPELLLLDEPDAHLDSDGRRLVGGLFDGDRERTRVIVSHDREGALADADLVLEL
ncbi:MAG: ABC transporter ATP-binding protein [Solirubrobacterales bacterium]